MIDNKKNPDLNDASELADIIDELMKNGSGHINISVNEDGKGIAVKTMKSNDCSGHKGACCQPNEPSDDDEN